MIRRSIMITAAAVALILVPSAAMAYQAPGITFTVSDATPTAGAPFTATVSGAADRCRVTRDGQGHWRVCSSAGDGGREWGTGGGRRVGHRECLSLIHISEP